MGVNFDSANINISRLKKGRGPGPMILIGPRVISYTSRWKNTTMKDNVLVNAMEKPKSSREIGVCCLSFGTITTMAKLIKSGIKVWSHNCPKRGLMVVMFFSYLSRLLL